MNQQLKELMSTAGYVSPELAGRAQKLADLTVRRCIDIIEGVAPGYADYRYQIEDEFRKECVEMIKQHFGVNNDSA